MGISALYQFLKSTKVALGCGLAATFFLIVGSFMMNFNPGVYSRLQGEDISFFFREFNILHFWFYMIVGVFILFGINALVCTLHSLVQSIKSRVKKLSFYGPALMHIGFLMALFGHLIAGLGSSSSPHVMVGKGWVDLDNAKVKLVNIDYSTFPNGMPKKADVLLQLDFDGRVKEVKVGFNDPYLWERGAKLLLFHRPGPVAEGIWIKVDHEDAQLLLGEVNKVGGMQIRLDQIFLPPSFRRPAAALSFSSDGSDWKSEIIPIGIGQRLPPLGKVIRFYNIITAEGVMLNIKTNPSISLVLPAMLLFLLGVILVLGGRLRKLSPGIH